MAGNVRKIVFTASFLSALLMFTAYSAGTQPVSVTTSISVFTDWLQLVILAVIAAVCIALIYYIIGILLNNKTIISAAFSEFENSLGTIVVVVIIIAVLGIFGSAATPGLLMPKTTAQSLCNTLQGANLNLVSTSQQGPANTICNDLIPGAGQGSTHPTADQLTNNIDYGLASTFLVVSNLTNQTVTNLNAYYIFNGYMGFLNKFNASDIMCYPGPACQEFGFGAFSVKYVFSPFAGYDEITSASNLLTTQSVLIFYLFIIQLITIIVLLHAWPYILQEED